MAVPNEIYNIIYSYLGRSPCAEIIGEVINLNVQYSFSFWYFREAKPRFKGLFNPSKYFARYCKMQRDEWFHPDLEPDY
jgi:hypothetical protein